MLGFFCFITILYISLQFTKQIQIMACSLHCPNCGEDLGKDTENSDPAYCGNCGEDDIDNPRGYDEDED